MAQYADIIEIIAPGQAVSGSTVSITARVQNLYSDAIGIMVVGVPDYVGLPAGEYISGMEPGVAVANAGPGETLSFAGSFTMPDKPVTVHIYSYWYGADGSWHFDDEMTKTINLATLTPQVSEFRIADFYKV